MTEAFLHYVWQFQYFDKTDLRTTHGEAITIVHTGHRHPNAGPDFFCAKVKMNNIEWIGTVEIHLDSGDWIAHKHGEDHSYDTVILHVVWQNNRKINRPDTTELPTLELKGRVSDDLLLQYRKLIQNPEKIPCAAQLPAVSSITRLSMLDRTLIQRLEKKAGRIQAVLKHNRYDWEETAYQFLCANFGFKINAGPFEQLARGLPYKVILKHADKLLQIEALLFGQAGFLDDADPGNEAYYLLLKREYALLAAKFGLAENRLHHSQWKFLRLRPANFPTLRLAQLASLLFHQKNLFSRILEAPDYPALLRIFQVTQSVYWRRHYQFFKEQKEEIPRLGEMSIANILINTVAPLMVAYGREKDEQPFVDRAVQMLTHVAPEDNAIIKNWNALGIKSRCAGDSQALIELHNDFCIKRRCLDCIIGFSILQSPHKC